ncbi:MAG: tetratricopeptide repeat protein [Bacteroidales bacterium]|nr:tetratricopeptide repeat protein [Bacteroidales bacterium]
MKKSIVLVSLLAVALGVNAQSMKVQSAYSDMKNERLANAKKNIDEACQNEKTMNDPKTWNYSGLIYAQIVDASNNNKKLFKKQKIDTPIEELCATGIASLRKCLELEEKAGTHEYVNSSIEALKVLCGYEYMFAGNVYNDGQYEKAAPMFAKVAEDAEIAKHSELLDDALYYQADCYRMLKQPEKEMALYRDMAKRNTTKADVYLKIYAANKQAGDTTKALNALKKGVKMTEKDAANNVIMKSSLASAYIWAGKQQEADKLLDDLLAKGANDTRTLNSIAGIYVDQSQVEKATELYKKSLAIDNNQLDAQRGIGLANFNKAVDLITEANNIPPDQQAAYDKKIAEAYKYMEDAIPYFQNALKIKDNDFNSLKALKTIYSRLGGSATAPADKKAEYKKELDSVNAKLNALLQK